MKKGLLVFFSFLYLFLINFVSAQFFDNYGYGDFSISSFFDSINSQDITIFALFLIFFAFLFLILTRINLFRDAHGNPNKGIASVISFGISLLAVYGIYRSGFSFGDLFSGIGVSPDSIYSLAWIIVIGAVFFIIWKLGISRIW